MFAVGAIQIRPEHLGCPATLTDLGMRLDKGEGQSESHIRLRLSVQYVVVVLDQCPEEITEDQACVDNDLIVRQQHRRATKRESKRRSGLCLHQVLVDIQRRYRAVVAKRKVALLTTGGP